MESVSYTHLDVYKRQGFAFGVAGIASAVLGNLADQYGIETVYNVCGYMPLIGLVTWFLPDLKKASEKGS